MEPEHYVFSTFGVLHVSPDYPSESMSLAEWQCDSVLFNAISKMAFFKNYLYRKMFTRYVNSPVLINLDIRVIV